MQSRYLYRPLNLALSNELKEHKIKFNIFENNLFDPVFELEPAVVKVKDLLNACTNLFTECTGTFQDALKDLNQLATDLLSSGTFNVEQIVEKRDNVNDRFLNVQNLAAAHHEKLKEDYALFQFFQDLDNEESWIQYVLPTHVV